MKILKPGKVEQRKFVCPNCGCEFAASKTEMVWTICGLHKCCPTCYQSHDWDKGEPYEEPTQDADVIEQLADLIYDSCVTDGEVAWEIAKHLIENGVTFREG